MADAIGSWWDTERSIVQPAEFSAGSNGVAISSTCSSGPIGRADPGDILALPGIYEKRRAAGA